MHPDDPSPRHDWTIPEARAIYELSVPELIYRAQTVHRAHNDPERVQMCTLLSIKTGGCPEDCAYCPQSAHYDAGVEREDLLDVDDVLEKARTAKEGGATRFCMGAAWREVQEGPEFESVLDMVRGVRELGMEACCTLGMLDDGQASRLADAGLTAYNHNLDTGPEFYDRIISTRNYDDRIRTLSSVRDAGIHICSGGIIGMGEEIDDRLSMLCVLASLKPHPESVPVNALAPVEGTPLGDRTLVDPIEMVRTIATARILLPGSRVRLSAGRVAMSDEAQALCFLAGADSIFTGETLLTTPNPAEDADSQLLAKLGMKPMDRPPTLPACGDAKSPSTTCGAETR